MLVTPDGCVPLKVGLASALADWPDVDFALAPPRQFVLHDVDGDYDHMEQLSLRLLFDPDDSELAGLCSGEL
jgi:hypothetical protein